MPTLLLDYGSFCVRGAFAWCALWLMQYALKDDVKRLQRETDADVCCQKLFTCLLMYLCYKIRRVHRHDFLFDNVQGLGPPFGLAVFSPADMPRRNKQVCY